MGIASSPNRGWLNCDKTKTFDVEDQVWETSSLPAAVGWTPWFNKPLRMLPLRAPRPPRARFCLLLIDIIIVITVVHAFMPLITLLRRNEELFGARLKLPLIDPPLAADQHPEGHMIPRILHQTTPSEEIPEKWAFPQRTCKEVYADYTYKLWTDQSARNFIAAEYPWFLETWNNYPFPIQRADAIRYFVLYHYGGIYLDMDTICNRTIPMQQIEATPGAYHAVFKSTKPTGVSNDLMIASRHHPIFAAAVSKLLHYNDITKLWARLLPYGAIMIATGPFFITMVIKNHLLEQPDSIFTDQLQVVNDTELLPYLTDLESCTWHRSDAQMFMWLGENPFVWYALGAIGLALGLHLINRSLLLVGKGLKNLPSITESARKVAKLT